MFEILSDRSIIHIVGLDSQKFLQSLTTNDVVNKIYTYNYDNIQFPVSCEDIEN